MTVLPVGAGWRQPGPAEARLGGAERVTARALAAAIDSAVPLSPLKPGAGRRGSVFRVTCELRLEREAPGDRRVVDSRATGIT